MAASSDEPGSEASSSRAARGGPSLVCAEDVFDKRPLGLLQRINGASSEQVSELLDVAFDIVALDPLAASEKLAGQPQRSRALLVAFSFFFRQCLRHDLSHTQVADDLKLARVEEAQAELVSKSYRQRKPALRAQLLVGIHRNAAAPFGDFDWKLHLQMGGDTIAKSREPLLVVSLDVDQLPKHTHKEVVFELDRASLDSFIAALERAHQAVAQVSV